MVITKEQLKRVRHSLEMTCAEFGQALGGYKSGTVLSWEHGKRGIPFAVAELVKVKYGVNMSKFTTDGEGNEQA